MSCTRRDNPSAFPGFVETVGLVVILVSLLLIGGCSLPTHEEGGVLYGSKVRVDFGSGGLNGEAFSTTTDMFVGGPEAQAGTGGLDGDAPNIGLPEFTDTGDEVPR